MHPLKTTSAALAGLTVLLMIVLQFVPWANFHVEGASFFGADFPDSDIEASTWNVEATSGGGGSDASWYDPEAKDYAAGETDLMQIRIAIPLLMAGGVLALLGLLLNFTTRGVGGVLTLVGGLVITTGTVLFAIGIEEFYGDAAYEWSAGFYLAITACACAIIGGALGMVASNTTDSGASP